MTQVIDEFAAKDSHRFQHRINSALGAETLTKWHELSDALTIAVLEDAGIALTNFDKLDPERIRQKINDHGDWDDAGIEAPVITGIYPDTGDEGDHVTTASTIQLLGTADPFVTVSIYDGAEIAAQATLHVSAVGDAFAAPSNGDTVTIDGKVYTFQSSLTNVDGHVKINGDVASNLYNAIKLGGGAGTAYAAATTVHPTVTVSDSFGNPDVIVIAKTPGVAGNSIAVSETLHNAGSWSSATLIGGDDASDDPISTCSADGAGAWRSEGIAVLSGSNHTFSAVASDIFDNVSDASDPYEINGD